MKLALPTAEAWIRECAVRLFEPQGLLERLRRLRDGRGDRGKRYDLTSLLLLIIFAKLAGEDTPPGIADWLAQRTADLRDALHLPWPRMLHHNTLRRVMSSMVDPMDLDQVVAEHLASLPGLGWSRLIAVDGKTVRGTISEENPQGKHLLAAYLPREGIVLGQVAVDRKENEIVAAPALLDHLDLRRKVVVGDALHAQREVSKQIKRAGGDFIWLIKDNQPAVRAEIAELFVPPTPTVLGNVLPDDFVRYATTTTGHGRREERRITVSSELKAYTAWPHLEQVFALQRQRTDLATGQVEAEIVYGVTSLSRRAASAKSVLAFIRDYGGIENGLHHRRDATFHEDRTRQTRGHAGHVMASLTNLVIGLLRYVGFTNLAHARRVCGAIFNPTTYLAIERMLT
jgi:predicted transposase YbfD/YdcC